MEELAGHVHRAGGLVDDLADRRHQLQPQGQGGHAAQEKHEHGRDEVHHPDPLVVDGGGPGPDVFPEPALAGEVALVVVAMAVRNSVQAGVVDGAHDSSPLVIAWEEPVGG